MPDPPPPGLARRVAADFDPSRKANGEGRDAEPDRRTPAGHARHHAGRAALAALGLGLLLAPAAALAGVEDPPEEPEGVANTVKLDLQITGVGPGWTVEIRPAHAGTRFEKVVRSLEPRPGEPVRLSDIAIDAKTLGADRACAFAIVLKGPDGEAETFKRSLRLEPADADEPPPVVSKTYYLRSTVVARRDDPKRAG